MNNDHEEAIALVAEALLLAPEAIDDGTALGITTQWDSLAHMRLILALEERLGRQLGPQDIVGIACLGDVVALLGGKNV